MVYVFSVKAYQLYDCEEAAINQHLQNIHIATKRKINCKNIIEVITKKVYKANIMLIKHKVNIKIILLLCLV
jgi:hypothetical protein